MDENFEDVSELPEDVPMEDGDDSIQAEVTEEADEDG